MCSSDLNDAGIVVAGATAEQPAVGDLRSVGRMQPLIRRVDRDGVNVCVEHQRPSGRGATPEPDDTRPSGVFLRRGIECRLVDDKGDFQSARIEGTIQRSFWNWYMAPMDTVELDRLHGSLSRRYDVAAVLTWIAGLLNLMVIWDAALGPAYGYGDEKPSEAEGDGTEIGRAHV